MRRSGCSHQAAFDVVASSFGAMFFGDPVRAFGNLAGALRPGGRCGLLTWRELSDNEWIAAIRAALAAGRTLPVPTPGSPGPFGLADADRARELLAGAGLVDIDIQRVDEPMSFGDNVDQAYGFVSGMGFARGVTADLEPAVAGSRARLAPRRARGGRNRQRRGLRLLGLADHCPSRLSGRRAQPRSSWTTSGVCSRTMNRLAWPGTASRVTRETPTIAANASGHAPGGRLAQQHVAPALRRPVVQRPGDAGAGAEPAGEQSRDGARRREAAPPDAEHQQRTERRRGDGERQPDRPRHRQVGREHRGGQRYADRNRGGDTERRDAGEAGRRARPARARRTPRSPDRRRSTGTPRTRPR